MGCLAVILSVTITKSESKIIKFTSGVFRLCSIQERSLVTTNCSPAQKKTIQENNEFLKMRRIWFIQNVCITASQMNWVVMATTVSLILKAAGSSFSHFYLMKLGESKNKLSFKSETKITKLLWFWTVAHRPF